MNCAGVGIADRRRQARSTRARRLRQASPSTSSARSMSSASPRRDVHRRVQPDTTASAASSSTLPRSPPSMVKSARPPTPLRRGHRRHDAAYRAGIGSLGIRVVTIAPASSIRRCSRDCPRRRASRLASRSPIPRVWAAPTSTRRWRAHRRERDAQRRDDPPRRRGPWVVP